MSSKTVGIVRVSSGDCGKDDATSESNLMLNGHDLSRSKCIAFR